MISFNSGSLVQHKPRENFRAAFYLSNQGYTYFYTMHRVQNNPLYFISIQIGPLFSYSLFACLHSLGNCTSTSLVFAAPESLALCLINAFEGQCM